MCGVYKALDFCCVENFNKENLIIVSSNIDKRMILRMLLTLMNVMLYVFHGFAMPLATGTNHIVERAADDGELVFTPMGPTLKSNIIQLPPGAQLAHTNKGINVIGSDGRVLHSTPISRDIDTTTSRRAMLMTDGWVASTYWVNTDPSPISTFSTSWTVPAPPTNISEALVFLFDAMESGAWDTILQPVLQFGMHSGAGGGNYWGVASWYLGEGLTYVTPLTTVKPGQRLTGVMRYRQNLTDSTGAKYSYDVAFTGLANSSLTVSMPNMLQVAFEAMEVYGAGVPANLPRGGTVMRGINVVEMNGKRPELAWTTYNVAADGYSVNVVTDGATNGVVSLNYPLSK